MVPININTMSKTKFEFRPVFKESDREAVEVVITRLGIYSNEPKTNHGFYSIKLICYDIGEYSRICIQLPKFESINNVELKILGI